MWIIPNSITLNSAPGTPEFISDLKEQSEICAQSLFLKSSPSPVRTWLQKWKRDSWTQLLSGRILKPSHGKNFTERWTSFQAAFPVNPSLVQDAEQAMKIQGTSSPTSSTDLSDLDSQDLFSLKTWKESSVQNSLETTGEIQQAPRFCSMSLESWKGWVTLQRLQWSQRAKLALLTGANASSSLELEKTWPTPQTSDPNGAASPDRPAHRVQLRDVENGMGDWPTPTTAEADKISNQANYGQQGLSNRPAIVGLPDREKGLKSRSGVATIQNGSMEPMLGQADQDSANTSGNPLGSWATPNTMDSLPPRSPEALKRYITEMRLGRTNPCNLREQVDPETMAAYKQWSTPRATGTEENIETWKARMERLPEAFSMPLPVQVQEYPTPRTTDYKSSPNAPSNAGRVENGLATLGEFIHNDEKIAKVKSTAKLSARWVETLMGLPIGWVNPLCTNPIAIEDRSYECSAMELSHNPVSELSVSSSVGSAKVEWSTPTVTMAPETVDMETFNGKFFKKPDGRKHQTDLQLQAQMHGNGDPKSWPTPTLTDDESLDSWAARRDRKAIEGINLHKPLSIAVRQELWPTPSADGDSRPGSNEDPVKWQEIADRKKAQGINKQLFLTTKVMMEENAIDQPNESR